LARYSNGQILNILHRNVEILNTKKTQINLWFIAPSPVGVVKRATKEILC